MKRSIAALLALLLCATLMPIGAFAASGDAILARRDSDSYAEDYISNICAVGDTLYLLGGNSLYTWKVGEADTTAYPWDYGDLRSNEGVYNEKTDTYTYRYMNAVATFANGGDLCIAISWTLNEGNVSSVESTKLYKVVIADGKATIEEVGDLDWEPMMEYYDDSAYAKYCEGGAFAQDGVLYAMVYGTSGDYEVYAVPLDGGYTKQIEEIESPYAICGYKDGKLLYEQFTYNESNRVAFCAYDPASETSELLCEMTVEDYGAKNGVTYSADTGLVYYMGKGSVSSLDLATLETVDVNDMPVTGYSGNGAVMLSGGYYAVSSYEATVVRNVDPAQRAEYKLTVSNAPYADAVQQTYYDFTNIRGDVSVVISNDYLQSSQIVEAMMNRSPDVDIYVLRMSDPAFDAVYSRGYMAELTQSQKLTDFVGGMYPSIASAMQKNGQTVSLPVQCYGDTMGYNTQALANANIKAEELPTNWVDFLAFLNELPARLEGTDVQAFYTWSTQSEMKNSLLNLIITDYQKYLNYSGKEQGYNTPVLREVLAALDQVDFGALGLPEEIDYENSTGEWSYDFGEVLIETGVSCTIGDYYRGYTAVAISMTADTPALLQLETTAAFVNPFSENKDIAIEFLEVLADNMPDRVSYNLFEDKNEGIRSPYYAEALENATESLKDLQDALEKADASEKQDLEESIQFLQERLDSIDKDYWTISPDAVAWYRANDDNLIVGGYNPFYSDNSGEIWSLMQQYAEGSLSMDQFLKAVDQKVQMMVLEGN